MGALPINDYKPFLSEESLLNIVYNIVSKLDVYNRSFFSDEFTCSNGFVIEVHAEYLGFNYRRIRLSYIEVHLWDVRNETYITNEDCEEYASKISDLLHDKIYDLNDIAEAEFDLTQKYCEL